MNSLSLNIKDFSYHNKFISILEHHIEKAQRAASNVMQKTGTFAKAPQSTTNGMSASNKILNNTADGWDKAREELLGIQAFEYISKR